MSDPHSSPYLQHHFDTLEQQRQASSLGMWVFIAQEIMFFGGLFLAYTYYRALYPSAFAAGSQLLSLRWGGFNTIVLICSSLTVALSVHAAQLGNKRGIIRYIIATMFLGVVFLGVKYIEYHAKFDHHLVPGRDFRYEPHAGHVRTAPVEFELPPLVASAAETGGDEVPAAEPHSPVAMDTEMLGFEPRHLQIFFSLYFAMTGMHALHMIIGIGLMFWLLRLAVNNRFAPEYYTPVELFGLYWHFVDIIWIFLFPLLYLI